MPARDLPPRPNLEQYRKQAKDLMKAFRRGDADALRQLREHHPHAPAQPTLADAQLVIAREHGIESWPKFVTAIEAASGRLASTTVWRLAEQAVVAGDAATLERLMRSYESVFRNERPQSWWKNTLHPEYQRGDARAVITWTHHFDSWSEFEAFQRDVRDPQSPVALFETAAEAIVTGDIETLRRLLKAHPELIRTRSVRNHHATLLHYVGANGIEGYRQHTPPNAVDILELLLAAGAEVDAIAYMYGRSTTLGLVATSLHPERAGLQQALIDVLLAHGARMDTDDAGGNAMPLVDGCLANGRGEAARHLAARGAPLDIPAAGGVGRIDLLAACFDQDGRIRPPATIAELTRAMVAAAAYGQPATVTFLLDRGIPVDAQPPGSTFTGANWAALNGDLEMLKIFMARGANLRIRNDYDGTALGAALWGAANRPRQEPYPPVIETLIAAGLEVEPGFIEWWERQEPRSPEAHERILELLRAHERSG